MRVVQILTPFLRKTKGFLWKAWLCWLCVDCMLTVGAWYVQCIFHLRLVSGTSSSWYCLVAGTCLDSQAAKSTSELPAIWTTQAKFLSLLKLWVLNCYMCSHPCCDWCMVDEAFQCWHCWGTSAQGKPGRGNKSQGGIVSRRSVGGSIVCRRNIWRCFDQKFRDPQIL